MQQIKQMFIKYFPKKYSKYSKKIIANIWIVDQKLKLSYLFDLFKPNKEAFIMFLEELKQEKFISNDVIMFYFNTILFICNRNFCLEICKGSTTSNTTFIDVSSDKPKFIENIQNFPTLSYFLKLMHYLSTMDVTCPTIKTPKGVDLTCLYGLLLSYPLVFCVQKIKNSDCPDFCISEEVGKLNYVEKTNDGVLIKDDCFNEKFDDQHSINEINFSDILINVRVSIIYESFELVVMSFSYPKTLGSECESKIENWKKNWESRFENLKINFYSKKKLKNEKEETNTPQSHSDPTLLDETFKTCFYQIDIIEMPFGPVNM